MIRSWCAFHLSNWMVAIATTHGILAPGCHGAIGHIHAIGLKGDRTSVIPKPCHIPSVAAHSIGKLINHNTIWYWWCCQTSNISHTKSQNLIFLVLSCSFLYPIHWSQVLSREWRCSWSSADRRFSDYIRVINNFIMPLPLGAGGIMFSGCPSVRPSEAWTTLFWPVHGSVGPPDQPYHFTACPSVHLSVRPSGVVSGHLPENAWRDWPEILHADVSWPSSELISLWPWSVDFSNFGIILT